MEPAHPARVSTRLKADQATHQIVAEDRKCSLYYNEYRNVDNS